MQITEPTTLLTDYLLAIFAFYLASGLWKANQKDRQLSVQLWAWAFIATACGALAGGTAHGFTLYLNDLAQAATWKVTVYAIGFASFFMLAGSIIAAVKAAVRNWLLGIAALELIIYAVWMVAHDDFMYVIYDYVPAMLGVLILQGYAYASRKDKSAGWIIAGILLSFFAAGVQQSGFTLHRHFNHNDLYHVIQMGAMYLLFRGAVRLRDQPGQVI